MIRKLYRDGGATATLGNPPVVFSEGRTVGGSTVINGGMSWRTPEPILERWAVEDGVDGIRPAAMDRYFQRVERFISAGLQDPDSVGRDNMILRRGAEAKNWKWIPNTRNQVHCAGSNQCAFGCPTGAKRSVLVSYLPRALQFGARVYSDVRVEKILFEGRRAVGVRGRVVQENGRPGANVEVRAKLVVVAGGAMQTPALLMRSGLRTRSHMLGKNLALHPNTKVQAFFDEDVEAYKGVHQAYQVREFRDEGFLFAAVNLPPGILSMALPYFGRELFDAMRSYHRIVNAGLLLEDSHFGHMRLGFGGQPMAFYDFDENDAKRAVRATALLCELLFAAGAKRVSAPFHGLDDLRSGDDARKLLDAKVPPSAMELFTVHIMGTVRMGSDPARHVCDSYGRVYDAESLVVSDASLFPSPIGVNPMETIMALATRNAERIIESKILRAA
jgi:choline dehydrogenase-like flavoprotein